MARIEPAVPQGLDPVRRLIFRSARRMYGRTLEPTGIVAHHRPLLVGYSAIALVSAQLSRALPVRLRELGMLRTAQLVGCEWCLDFGSMLARKGGVPESDLRALMGWRESGRFDATDRLVLEYAEAMTRTPVEVGDELFARLREAFDERQVVELTMAIALENMYARSNWAFGIEGEGFSEGGFCVPAETLGASPATDRLPASGAPR